MANYMACHVTWRHEEHHLASISVLVQLQAAQCVPRSQDPSEQAPASPLLPNGSPSCQAGAVAVQRGRPLAKSGVWLHLVLLLVYAAFTPPQLSMLLEDESDMLQAATLSTRPAHGKSKRFLFPPLQPQLVGVTIPAAAAAAAHPPPWPWPAAAPTRQSASAARSSSSHADLVSDCM